MQAPSQALGLRLLNGNCNTPGPARASGRMDGHSLAQPPRLLTQPLLVSLCVHTVHPTAPPETPGVPAGLPNYRWSPDRPPAMWDAMLRALGEARGLWLGGRIPGSRSASHPHLACVTPGCAPTAACPSCKRTDYTDPTYSRGSGYRLPHDCPGLGRVQLWDGV